MPASIVTVNTVSEFSAALADIPLKNGRTRFFRGHADYNKYKLEPSVYRKPNLIKNEEKLIQETIIRCPDDLPPSLAFFETLVKLQHYSLPTRLLDLTANVLVALYFACRHKEKTAGEVVVIDVPTDQVKYYDSDTVAVISNIAKRDTSFDLNDLPTDKTQFNDHDEVRRLLHDIRKDKPAFQSLIEPTDLRRVIAVRPRLDNARLARQDGAFLLFGIDGVKTSLAKVPDDWVVCGNTNRRIIFSAKHRLKRELASFGISEQALFPELDSQAQAIVSKFSNKYARTKKG